MRILISSILFLILSAVITAQPSFDAYFTPASLRFDYILAGNSDTSLIYYHQLKKEPFWGGSRTQLIDSFNFGDFMLKVTDVATGTLIYSHGFSDLFREWQATSQAKILKKAFTESVIMPFPRKSVQIEIYKRKRDQSLYSLFKFKVNPSDIEINRDTLAGYSTEKIIDSGDPAQKVDVVFIPEGYTAADMEKFRRDAKRFAGYLMSWSPFKENANKFNFWIVNAPSLDKGTDIPGRNIWKRTAVNSNFYTFGTDRYLTTTDIYAVRDIAAHVPYDQICILVNTEKYGGGGIYNFYNLCTTDNSNSEFVFCHEFGHAFGGLADEYVEPGLQTASMYNLKAEPWEPNITTLVHFDRKWKGMLPKETVVPTPISNSNENTLGVFEGAGYLEKGIYRPAMDCSMRSVRNNFFCPVCQEAIRKMILSYTR
jgi:IgA Peptidase M64/Peptidase M64 N-terminus